MKQWKCWVEGLPAVIIEAEDRGDARYEYMQQFGIHNFCKIHAVVYKNS